MSGLLDGVRRVIDDAPCACRARQPRLGDHDASDDLDTDPAIPSDTGAGPESRGPRLAGTGPSAWGPSDALSLLRQTPLGGDGELPPGPWRWRWVWPTPGRPAGMALVASDGTLVLWSPGGFTPPDAAPDGRPTADIATVLAKIPDLSKDAARAEVLRWELERARAAADETKRLLNRVAGAVDDEIGRAQPANGTDGPVLDDT